MVEVGPHPLSYADTEPAPLQPVQPYLSFGFLSSSPVKAFDPTLAASAFITSSAASSSTTTSTRRHYTAVRRPVQCFSLLNGQVTFHTLPYPTLLPTYLPAYLPSLLFCFLPSFFPSFVPSFLRT